MHKAVLCFQQASKCAKKGTSGSIADQGMLLAGVVWPCRGCNRGNGASPCMAHGSSTERAKRRTGNAHDRSECCGSTFLTTIRGAQIGAHGERDGWPRSMAELTMQCMHPICMHGGSPTSPWGFSGVVVQTTRKLEDKCTKTPSDSPSAQPS
jgi:hypothetical protein